MFPPRLHARPYRLSGTQMLVCAAVAFSSAPVSAQSPQAIDKLCRIYAEQAFAVRGGQIEKVGCDRVRMLVSSVRLQESKFHGLVVMMNRLSRRDLLHQHDFEKVLPGCKSHLTEGEPHIECASSLAGADTVMTWNLDSLTGWPTSIVVSMDLGPMLENVVEGMKIRGGYDAVMPVANDLIEDIIVLNNMAVAAPNEFYRRDRRARMTVTVMNIGP